ncbi:Ubiquitin-conjugating enzyme E2 R1 [Nymphon striatum]|nr:Ubiquitin-conjugating enzyme E2 R1 [Nymphon striatum]
MRPACTYVWVRDLGNYRYPVEKIGECPTQYGKKDPRKIDDPVKKFSDNQKKSNEENETHETSDNKVQKKVAEISKNLVVKNSISVMNPLTVEEFNNIPKYLKGRLQYGVINNVINEFNTTIAAKYKILNTPKKKLTGDELNLHRLWKKQETSDTKAEFQLFLRSKVIKMAQPPSSSALRALALEFKGLQEEPVEGFRVKLVNEDVLNEWEVAIFGPPDTLYQGGYFKAHVKFPLDYPYSPPSVRFLTKVWHPNVYENGELCISILHPPIDDPQSGELPCERWNPTQNVRTVLLSVISLLNEPNTFSPANVDASVMYRRFKDSKGKDKEYENIIRRQVTSSRLEADKDKVVVPLTREDYCIQTKAKPSDSSIDMTDFYNDDYGDELEDDDEDESDVDNCCEDDEEDSGNGES